MPNHEATRIVNPSGSWIRYWELYSPNVISENELMDGIAVSSVQATKRSTPRRAMQGFAKIANTHFELPQKMV
jgi:hypothetical protein